MRPHHALSDFIAAEPEESLPKRIAAVLLPRTTISATAVLALIAVTAAGQGPLPQQLAEMLANQASDHARINIQAAVNAGVLLYAGELTAMSILEKLMKPLITAGEERGEAKAKAEFEAWKQNQRERGVVFAEDDEPKDTNDEQSRRSTHHHVDTGKAHETPDHCRRGARREARQSQS